MSYPKERARKLYKKYNTNNPFKIAKEKGIVLLFEDLGKNIMGYCIQENRIPIIHINNRLDEFETIFAISHELGHCILHPKVNTPFLRKNTLFSVGRIELEANQFAVHLLAEANVQEINETTKNFLLRCGIPEYLHIFY